MKGDRIRISRKRLLRLFGTVYTIDKKIVWSSMLPDLNGKPVERERIEA